MKGLKTISLNPFTPRSDLIDFTLSNARRLYSSKGDPLGVKGLKMSIFFPNFSPEVILHLLLKASLTHKVKQKITPVTLHNFFGNVLKSELSEQAKQMGALVVCWDLRLEG